MFNVMSYLLVNRIFDDNEKEFAIILLEVFQPIQFNLIQRLHKTGKGRFIGNT